jgi:dephospho-CoA kinase
LAVIVRFRKVKNVFVIGLTGNFGTGKTTVSQMLAELGAAVINADELGHEVLQPDTQAYREVVAAFGKSILKPDGEIDRTKLGQLVFGDTEALTRLNEITHPRIYEIVRQRIEEYRKRGASVVVLEAALLVEAGWTSLADQVWVTTAPEATIVRRLKKARGLSREQVLTRLRAQMPQAEKAKRADVIISTDCTLDELRAKIRELWHNLP